MSDRDPQANDDTRGFGALLHLRQTAVRGGVEESRRAPDIDLHGHPGLSRAPADEIDMHPLTSVVVTSQAPYAAPPTLPGPNTVAQGIPAPPGLTEWDLGFKPRVPLLLCHEKRSDPIMRMPSPGAIAQGMHCKLPPPHLGRWQNLPLPQCSPSSDPSAC
ncbi:uncharacterized protein LOC143282772 [Babylonia areolata]|uniref:uncharacterized protein LOC143282772 n=1 Tax=Babylonia areolata TaxID=304850 RepID=UPI003FD5E67B